MLYNAGMVAKQKAAKTPAGENGARGVMAEQKPEESGEDKEAVTPLARAMGIFVVIGVIVFMLWLLKVSFVHIIWPMLALVIILGLLFS